MGVLHEAIVQCHATCRDIRARRLPTLSCMRGACANMERGRITSRKLVLATALALVVGGLALRARADTAAYDLVIQRSPLDAGEVTPNTGAHRISANSTVTLTASAEPGYRFAYWLGDVSDPAAERTTVVVDQAKIVIAVFHPEPDRHLEEQLRPAGAGGGETLAMSATDVSAPRWSPAGGAAKGDTKVNPTIAPVVVPEPATIAMVALGMIALSRRRKPPAAASQIRRSRTSGPADHAARGRWGWIAHTTSPSHSSTRRTWPS